MHVIEARRGFRLPEVHLQRAPEQRDGRKEKQASLDDAVTSRRTTSGTLMAISRAAATTPSAMMSQRMMPPKMLTRMPFTLGSDRMILKAAATFSLDALPPTSRKLAGSMPYSLMMSMVAMARPAPLTMQPISPSS